MTTTLLIPPNILKAAALFASTDETRYVLNGVRIEISGKGRVLAVATDGRRLLAINATDECEIQWPPDYKGGDVAFTVPMTLIEALPPAVVGVGRLQVTDDGKTVTAKGKRTVTVDSHGEVVYPKWRDVIPSGPEEPMPFLDVNAGLLNAYLKVISLLRGNGSVRITQTAPIIAGTKDEKKKVMGPFLIRSGDSRPEWFGILMPMRGNQVAGTPSWLE